MNTALRPEPKSFKIRLYLTYLVGFALLLSMVACNDIIEPSIKNKQETLEAPGDQYQSTSYSINFWWDEVANASKYHLQVVTPNFDQIGSLVLDTVVTNTKFIFTLQPGNYAWRVRAENGSSQTPYSTPRNFTVVSSSLQQQTVQLVAPANNLVTNQSAAVLQWSPLYSATQYQLEIDTNNFADETVLVYNQTIPGQQYNFSFPKDKIYQWRVRAQNDTAKSQWSAINTLTYDHTPPAQVTLVSPTDGAIISAPATLQWSNVATAVKYKLYVFKTDSTTTYSSSFPMILSNNNFILSTGTSGDRVYWKVSAIDAAGNEGAASTQRSFVWQ